MPVPDSDLEDRLRRFWSSNEGETGQLVNCFEFTYAGRSGAPSFEYRVCDFGRPITLTHEDSNQYAYEPLAMQIQLPTVEDSTAQDLELTLDGCEGYIYSIVRDLSPEARSEPIRVAHRLYLSEYPAVTMTPTPIRYRVNEATATLTTITLRLSVLNLPNRLAGEYYTSNRFPGVVR